MKIQKLKFFENFGFFLRFQKFRKNRYICARPLYSTRAHKISSRYLSQSSFYGPRKILTNIRDFGIDPFWPIFWYRMTSNGLHSTYIVYLRKKQPENMCHMPKFIVYLVIWNLVIDGAVVDVTQSSPLHQGPRLSKIGTYFGPFEVDFS